MKHKKPVLRLKKKRPRKNQPAAISGRRSRRKLNRNNFKTIEAPQGALSSTPQLMKDKKTGEAVSKDTLSQADLKNDVKTFEQPTAPHAALETPDGKNNGAEPAVYRNQRKSRT